MRQLEVLDELLPEAFALVREAGDRTIGLRHFDVQMIGGAVLHSGRIAEMRTGEGKTLVATLPVSLISPRLFRSFELRLMPVSARFTGVSFTKARLLPEGAISRRLPCLRPWF